VEDIVKFSIGMKIFRDIVFDEFEPFVPHQVSNIFNILFLNQVVHADDLMSLGNKKIAKVGTEKSRPPCDQRPFHFIPPADSVIES
jgi:hypothetical protein